ncbi:MAG: galactose oxidase-like domain-containing protein [Myxococcales bacterium]
MASTTAVSQAQAQAPSVVGSWEAPFNLPLIAIHSAVLPTGKVLLFSAEHGVPGVHGWILNPSTLGLVDVPPPPPWDPDCAGHSFLSDGRLVVAGGTLSFSPLTGTKLAYTFDPFTERWTRLADMARGRWYPTSVTLDDGTSLTLSGLSEVPNTPNPDIELWDPAVPGPWQLLGQKSLPYYPLLHLMPSGLVFMAGPSRFTETYDHAINTWTPVDATNSSDRYEACSVLLPPSLDRVMLIGGYDGSGQPTKSAEIIDLTATTPQWRVVPHMAFARMEHNAVLLPDGKVLVVGGRSDYDSTPTPVLTPEIFNPSGETWTSVAAHSTPRRYHSTAVLLPDGRVLAAGGDYQPTGEIYSPPYLFRGPRPVLVAAPATIFYGSTVSLEFTGTTGTHTAVLMALPCVTHSNNMCQRYVSLGTIASSGGTVAVPAPASGTVAPPGYYMLFVVDSGGVPSISRMVRVLGSGGDPGSVPATLTMGKAVAPQGDLTIQWEASCAAGAASYGIYQGTIGAWYSHTRLDCNDDGSNLIEQLTPATESSYYLVVPHNIAGEGSYGRCSPGVCLAADERPVGAAECVVPQVLTSCP